MMRLGRVDKEIWTLRLAPQLMGKEQQAYVALSAIDYKVKEAILRRYNISEALSAVISQRAEEDG